MFVTCGMPELRDFAVQSSVCGSLCDKHSPSDHIAVLLSIRKKRELRKALSTSFLSGCVGITFSSILRDTFCTGTIRWKHQKTCKDITKVAPKSCPSCCEESTSRNQGPKQLYVAFRALRGARPLLLLASVEHPRHLEYRAKV